MNDAGSDVPEPQRLNQESQQSFQKDEDLLALQCVESLLSDCLAQIRQPKPKSVSLANDIMEIRQGRRLGCIFPLEEDQP